MHLFRDQNKRYTCPFYQLLSSVKSSQIPQFLPPDARLTGPPGAAAAGLADWLAGASQLPGSRLKSVINSRQPWPANQQLTATS